MLVTGGVCEKNEGDASGESILTGFGSSSGSSTDETSEQEDLLAELARKMAENMLQDEEEEEEEGGEKAKEPIPIQQAANNYHKTTLFQPNNVVQNQQHGKVIKEHGGDSIRAGFMSSALPNGSGMRAGFLGESGSRNGSSGGTGVFIPRATYTRPYRQPRKKSGRYSRVLIPERVLQSLKQHHENRNAGRALPNAPFHAPQKHQETPNRWQHQENRNSGRAHPNAWFQRLQHQETPNRLQHQQETPNRLQHQATPNKKVVNSNKDDNDIAEELRLPQEWTY